MNNFNKILIQLQSDDKIPIWFDHFNASSETVVFIQVFNWKSIKSTVYITQHCYNRDTESSLTYVVAVTLTFFSWLYVMSKVLNATDAV